MRKLQLFYFSILFVATIISVYFYKRFNPQSFVAEQALASYLGQPKNTITCKKLKGGLSGDSVNLCTYLHDQYIVKSFQNKIFGKHEIAWTKHASNLGIGSHLYMADPQGLYYISAVAPGTALTLEVASKPKILNNIAQALSVLHHSQAPTQDINNIDERIATKYHKIQSTGALQTLLQQKYAAITQILQEIAKYPVATAPCHNDLNPGNIFVADNQITMIDWGDSALGNPYYDIAIFFMFNLIQEDKQLLFFKAYNPELSTQTWKHYFALLAELVYFEFALNLLLSIQEQNPALLAQSILPATKPIAYYLTLFADIKTDNQLLEMALASLHTIKIINNPASTNAKTVIKQYDVATISKVLNREIPNLKIDSINVIQTGWDHLVAEVNGDWIFRFPRTEDSIANLKREKQLLDYLKNHITLSIPDYHYFGTDIAFVGYRKILGIHLNPQMYGHLNLDIRHDIAKTLACFFTQLHHTVSKEQALQLGYTNIIRPLEEIESTLIEDLPANIAIMMQKAIVYARKDLSKKQDFVFIHQDVNGDNVAFNATAKQIIGVFDFSDAGIGPYSWEFAELFAIDAELARLTAEIYAKMNHVPNPLIGGAADYILRKATLILEARKKGNSQTEINLLKELCDFIPVWHNLLESNVNFH